MSVGPFETKGGPVVVRVSMDAAYSNKTLYCVVLFRYGELLKEILVCFCSRGRCVFCGL